VGEDRRDRPGRVHSHEVDLVSKAAHVSSRLLSIMGAATACLEGSCVSVIEIQ
jgi:hypothetical protein